MLRSADTKCAILIRRKIPYFHQTQDTVGRWSQSLSVPIATVCFVALSDDSALQCMGMGGGGHEGTPVSLMIYKPGILLSVKNLHRLPGSWRFPLSVGVTLKSALLYMVLKRRKYRIDICKCGGDFVVDTLLVEWQMVAKWEKITVYHPVIDPSIFFFFFSTK